MFQFATGVKISKPEKIKEEYQLFDEIIRANISFEHLAPIIEEFYDSIEEPMFLAIHCPLTQSDEEKVKTINKTRNDEILYLDGCTRKQIENIFQIYGNILLNDGMSQFAIASHKTKDEIFIRKYKLVDIFGKNRLSFIPVLKKHGIVETKNLKTVWDTFTHDAPGECSRIEIDGKDIYDIVSELKVKGLYSAKIVETHYV
jgi:hypothetical protein